MDPIYKIRDEEGKVIDYGLVPGSKVPVPYFRKDQKDVNVNSVKDIEFATTDTRKLGNFKY